MLLDKIINKCERFAAPWDSSYDGAFEWVYYVDPSFVFFP